MCCHRQRKVLSILEKKKKEELDLRIVMLYRTTVWKVTKTYAEISLGMIPSGSGE